MSAFILKPMLKHSLHPLKCREVAEGLILCFLEDWPVVLEK